MKTTIITLLALASVSAFAEDCKTDAIAVAKMNLDQLARKIGHSASDIGAATFVKTEKSKIAPGIYETLSVYSVIGSIYRADYTITTVLDESCGVRSVSIHDDSTPRVMDPGY